jgi:hypothetical protein
MLIAQLIELFLPTQASPFSYDFRGVSLPASRDSEIILKLFFRASSLLFIFIGIPLA